MAMKKREKVLAGTTGALLATFAGVFLFGGSGGGSLGELRTTRDQLQKKVQQQEGATRPLKKAAGKLTAWRERSLPSDPRLARELYNEWLLELAVEKVRLKGADITPYADQPHRGIYTTLPFKIEGQGTLEQLTRFLYEFYSANFLHKVRNLTLTPTKSSQDLKLVISVEAVSMPDAKYQDKLPEGKSQRLEYAELDKYVKAIVQRKMEEDRVVEAGGLFAAWTPKVEPRPPEPPPPAPPGPETIDASQFTFVNAIHEVDGTPEVWLFVRTEDRTLRLHEGASFEVGKMSGKVARIRVDELNIEIEVDGRRKVVDFGNSLQSAVELP